jgi:hypothetical protein
MDTARGGAKMNEFFNPKSMVNFWHGWRPGYVSIQFGLLSVPGSCAPLAGARSELCIWGFRDGGSKI